MLYIDDALGAAITQAIKDALDGGTLYEFSGTPPANASVALDMVATHTQLVAVTNNDAGAGVTFETPTDCNLNKKTSETWHGTANFDGKDDGLSELTPTFYRIGAPGDDCRGAATGPRIQGTISGPSGGGDIENKYATISNGTDVPVGLFRYTVSG